MNIDRDVEQGNVDVALHRVSFCLDQLEKALDFEAEIDWGTEIVERLTVEEIIGALVTTEQAFIKISKFEKDVFEKVVNKKQLETMPIFEVQRIDYNHVKFKCPNCGRKNTHGWITDGADYSGHRVAHCQCWPNGYYIIMASEFNNKGERGGD